MEMSVLVSLSSGMSVVAELVAAKVWSLPELHVELHVILQWSSCFVYSQVSGSNTSPDGTGNVELGQFFLSHIINSCTKKERQRHSWDDFFSPNPLKLIDWNKGDRT